MSQSSVIEKLNSATSNYNFIHFISAFIVRDFCKAVGKIDRTTHTALNYNEAALLIGLWIKNCSAQKIHDIDVNQTFTEIYRWMEELHYSMLLEFPRIQDVQGNVVDAVTNGPMFKEAFFYGSTGGYDYQYIEKTPEKYRYDNRWIIDNKGFALELLSPFFKKVKDVINARLTTTARKWKTSSVEDLTAIFCFSKEELTEGNLEYESIVKSFTIDLFQGANKNFNVIGDFNEFFAKPIIRISESEYYIPMPFFLAEAFFEVPFYWMNADQSYIAKAHENRGLVAEEITFNLFSPIFGRENTFKGVKIFENKGTTVSDIDVIGIYKDTAVIAQVKSKKLTSVSKQGNLESIKNDFKKAIEDAFLQGLKCASAIHHTENYTFSGDDNLLKNKFEKIKEVYIICVVLDYYPALSHLTHILLYEKYSESTICLSTLDLEVICHYLNRPNLLVDYIKKRVKNCRNYHAENELCYLGFYLDHDFKPLKEYDKAMIDNSYGTKIDRLYYPTIAGIKVPNKKKVGRNEACPCGSNIKYKRCHGR